MVTEARRIVADPAIVSAAPKVDGTGLDVTVLSGQHPSLLNSSALPVTVSTGQRPQGMFTRQADTPQFWGGARYNSPVGGCSTGFAVSVGGIARDLSAGHCGTAPQTVSIPGQPNPTGTIVSDNKPRDTLLINFSGGVSGRIYTGAFNSASSVGVGGAANDFVGNLVCTGGASSGEHCGITVRVVDEFVNVGYIIGPETRASYPSATCAVAPGDSGGPAYSYRADGRIDARGTISAGITGTATCPGIVANGSSTVWYAPLLRPAGDPQIGSLQFYGAAVILG
jgi:hypothetical protein